MPGTGLLPATVPGACSAWVLLVERWGTWGIRDLLDYAMRVRASLVLPEIGETISTVAEMFGDHWEISAQIEVLLSTEYNGGMGGLVVAELRSRGHEVDVQGPWTRGRLSAVSREGSVLRAAANPRDVRGYAAGR